MDERISKLPKWTQAYIYELEERAFNAECRQIDERIVDETKIVLRRVLQECLAAQVEREYAPMSRVIDTHLNIAITLLSKMVPDYEPSDEEMKYALDWAKYSATNVGTGKSLK